MAPGGRGGSWSDPANLVVACWPCNSGKADFTLDELGWDLLGEADVRNDWDGLTGSYRAVWDIAGQPDAPYHGRCLRPLDAARGS